MFCLSQETNDAFFCFLPEILIDTGIPFFLSDIRCYSLVTPIWSILSALLIFVNLPPPRLSIKKKDYRLCNPTPNYVLTTYTHQ